MTAQPKSSAFDLDVGDEANAFARNYPDRDLTTIAEALEARLAHYSLGETFGRAVAAELRKRHKEGLRVVMRDDPEDDAAWTTDRGGWHPIDGAPKQGRIDLWVDIFELDGELVEDCWWEADAMIPDWYRMGADGRAELAAPIFGHAAFWKARNGVGGPVADGGPGLLARTNVADDAASWPPSMRTRYEAYLAAADEGRIEPALMRRGVSPPSPVPAEAEPA